MSDWSLACPDWEARLRDGRSLVPDLPLDEDAANLGLAVFDRLRLPDVQGNPFLADAAGPWFRDIVRAAFGSWVQSSGERFIREIFALIGKKNSKTSYSAGLAITWLLVNVRPKAVGILVAPTQDITDIAYSQAEGMVMLDPGLHHKRLRVQNHLRKITNLKTGATLEILTFDPSILTGQKPAFWLLDELHIIAKSSKAASALGQLRGGMISQPEAFGIIITTQSEAPPTGVFKTELAKARNVRDGRDVTTRVLPVLYEFPPAIARDRAAWGNPKNWPMVVPNNGRSISVGRLVQEFAVAEQSGAEELKRWSSQHLNIEVGIGLQTDHWPGARHWEEQGDSSLDLDQLLDRSEVVTIGIDGGGLDDLLGVCVLGRETGTGRWLQWGKAFVHKNVLELRKSEAPRLLDFQNDGDLTIVEKMKDAFAAVCDLVVMIAETGKLAKVGVDPFGVKIIIDELARRGISQDNGQVEGVSQGFKLQGVIKSCEDKLSDGDLIHSAQPIMAWSVGNARIELKGNAILVTKQASGTGKIDLLMAMYDAGSLMLDEPEADGPSIYNNELVRPAGFLVV